MTDTEIITNLVWHLPEDRRLVLLVMSLLHCHNHDPEATGDALLGLWERLANSAPDMPVKARMAARARAAGDGVHKSARLVMQ